MNQPEQIMAVLTPTNQPVDPNNPPVGIIKYGRRITNAELLITPTSPKIAITPNLPTNRRFNFLFGSFILNLQDGAYASIDASCALGLRQNDNQSLSCYADGTFLAGYAPYTKFYCPLPPAVNANIFSFWDALDFYNQPIVLSVYNNNVDFTGGGPNNYLDVSIWIEVLDVS